MFIYFVCLSPEWETDSPAFGPPYRSARLEKIYELIFIMEILKKQTWKSAARTYYVYVL